MTDQEKVREKVIEGLERCDLYGYCADKQCPYYENVACHEALRRDALSLLKEQESFQPFRSGDYHPDWCCGNCKYPGLYGRMKFCPECGKAVKWDK